MKILGSVFTRVTIPGIQPREQPFQVLDSVTYSNIIQGRDFMQKFGTARFDFKKSRIEFGKLSIADYRLQVAILDYVKVPSLLRVQRKYSLLNFRLWLVTGR